MKPTLNNKQCRPWSNCSFRSYLILLYAICPGTVCHLSHCIRNRLYILEESNFNFRYTRLWNLHILREKWLNYLQTVETLIRHRVLQRLIWICTVCQVLFYRSPDYNSLFGVNITKTYKHSNTQWGISNFMYNEKMYSNMWKKVNWTKTSRAVVVHKI